MNSKTQTRRRTRELGVVGSLVVWLAGAATIYYGSFYVPGPTVILNEDKSFKRIELDWDNTLGERLFRRVHE